MARENINEMFSRAAERFKHNVAIESLDKTVTYNELENESNNLANFLISSGASKGAIVAVLAEDTISVITAILAIMKAGCAFVPLDPSTPVNRIETMMTEVSAEWFIVESGVFEKVATLAAKTASRPKVICIDKVDVGDRCHDKLIHLANYATYLNVEKPSVPLDPDHMCYVYFTSGSTGRPKGIAGRLKSVSHFVEWEIKTFNVGEGTRVSQLTAPSFDALLRDVFTPLCAGGVVCAPRGNEITLDVNQLIEWINDKQINLIHCVPSIFRAIVNQDLNPSYFLSLKHILMSGEPLLPSDVRRWMTVYGERVQLVNLYGPTETTMVKFFYFVKPSDKDRRFIPIGKPMEGAAAIIVDANGKACPPGTVGEIYIRTPYRTLGYFNQPELTNEVFIQNPFNDDPTDLVYKTGDFGRVTADGNYEFLGRKDQQVKIRGVRIELREIEDAFRRHDSIADVTVIDREDQSGYKYLCAYIVQNGRFELGALREFLSAYLPDYMMPSAFVVMDELPRTISGKVDRRALPTPDQARKDLEANYVAPRTPVEGMLADIWGQVLGIPRVGIHDNFFVSGGHSLLAMQVLNRVRTAFGVELPLRRLFGATTVAELALVVTQAQVEQENAEEMAQMIESIRHLSDEDLEHLLAEEAQLAVDK
jgi:amino acid adenylation domain-containing protein